MAIQYEHFILCWLLFPLIYSYGLQTVGNFGKLRHTLICFCSFLFCLALLQLRDNDYWLKSPITTVWLILWRRLSGAVSSLISREIFRVLQIPKFCYRVYKNSSLLPILSQLNPVHVSPSYLFYNRFNIIIQPTPWSSKWYLYFELSDPNTVHIPLPQTLARLILKVTTLIVELLILPFYRSSNYFLPIKSKLQYSPKIVILYHPSPIILIK